MFLCVVVFGLFHGILLLPVLLSLMGSHSEHDEDQLEDMVRSLFESFSILNDSCSQEESKTKIDDKTKL